MSGLPRSIHDGVPASYSLTSGMTASRLLGVFRSGNYPWWLTVNRRGRRDVLRSPAAGDQELLQLAHHRRDVATLRRQPPVVVVGVPVALPAVADERDDGPVVAAVKHLGHQQQRPVEASAGRAADLAV